MAEPRTDTVEYTADDLAEARRQIAAMLNHKCTPRWWPHRMGETWRCDDCGGRWVADEAQNFTDPTSIKAIRLGLLDPLMLGWRKA